MKIPTNQEIRLITHSPSDAADKTRKLAQAIQNDPRGGVKSGLPGLDYHLRPFRPGDLVTVMGYTSHYKSGLMNWYAYQAAKSIMERRSSGDNNAFNEIVIKVTLEQSIEEDTLAWMAQSKNISISRVIRGQLDKDDWALMDEASVRRSVTPLWLVGHSLETSKETRRARPRLSMTGIALAVEFILNEITGQRFEPVLLIIDYLQRIHPDEHDGPNRREHMMNIVNRAKDAAISFGIPTMLGIQTGRRNAEGFDNIPRIDDGMETAAIEQVSDIAIGTWYPIKNETPGKQLEVKICDDKGMMSTKFLKVDPSLLISRILKQKLGAAPLTFAMQIDPTRNLINSASQVFVS